ncbi:hypothetical protein [Amycolatopsis vastitatis]|uniref:Uncharacterized protein n=1 Tax=Amycolatopsis vastitatis TaxID=1905142 RepID=A0A229SR15_9PSEU|nr:hypothetical protein [Amycolatopsis vastitatis]OXM61346.1 hypothetical protein CF165_38345 [Amycolatopsis vastitatis]
METKDWPFRGRQACLAEGSAILVHQLVTTGRAAPAQHRVVLVRTDAGQYASLHEFVRDRFAGLAEDELSAVRLVALAEPAETDVIASLVDPAVLDRLRRRGMLIEVGAPGRRRCDCLAEHAVCRRAHQAAIAYANISRNARICLASTSSGDAPDIWRAIQAETNRKPVNAQHLIAPNRQPDAIAPFLNGVLALRCRLIITTGSDMHDAVTAAAKSHPDQAFASDDKSITLRNVRHVATAPEITQLIRDVTNGI